MSDEEKSKMENSNEEGVDSGGSYCSLEELPPIPRRIFLEKEEKVKRPGSFWKRPPTKVYADNFGFGVNGYQPMIDYLDSKDTGEKANKKDVHLPYSEERCMNKYSANKPFKLYSNLDIDKYIAKGEKIRTQIRQNDAAGASNVLRRTHTNWSMTKKYVQLVKNSYVIDFRKLHSNDQDTNSFKQEHTRPKSDSFIAVPKLKYRVLSVIPENYNLDDMTTSALFGTYIRQKLDHENTMAQRRDRLQALDDQYEESIRKLASTVDRLHQRERSLPPTIVSPQGNVYTPDEMLRVADDLIASNRLKRQQDLHRLQNSVDTLTDASRQYCYRPRNALQFLGDEVSGINAATMAITKSNAIKAAIASRTAAGLMNLDDDKIDRRIKDMRRRNETMQAIDGVSYLPQTRRRVIHEDVISDVQDRVMNRARELTGETSESRRIRNRAKFMNTVTPKPDTGAVDLRIPPSRTERNIVYMSRSLAQGGVAARKYEIEDEIDEPVSCVSTNVIENYCTRSTSRPIPQFPSDSLRVRNAVNRARTRNTLLGN